ncbi:MAG: antitoxin VbhA family protein [Candidatus Limivicinus sp.]|nr:antitoxin VbhA family protein [Clostridiales bacterium]MDY6132904.1 antitoxin VbhA family protein [Candidatus Limivicinus sp.]
MTKKAERNLKYTLATHAAENMMPSRKAISLCEKIANGQISGDMAVEEIKRYYGVESGYQHA